MENRTGRYHMHVIFTYAVREVIWNSRNIFHIFFLFFCCIKFHLSSLFYFRKKPTKRTQLATPFLFLYSSFKGAGNLPNAKMNLYVCCQEKKINEKKSYGHKVINDTENLNKRIGTKQNKKNLVTNTPMFV